MGLHDHEYITNNEQCFDATWAFALALNRTLEGNTVIYQLLYLDSGVLVLSSGLH